MVPWPKTRYHLLEHYASASRPEEDRELFNLRHASLRNCVERAFGVFKRRWRIYDAAREFSMHTQVQLIYALTAVSNWIIDEDEDNELSSPRPAETDEALQETAGLMQRSRVPRAQESPMETLRDEITIRLWNKYQDLQIADAGGLRPRTVHQRAQQASQHGQGGSNE